MDWKGKKKLTSMTTALTVMAQLHIWVEWSKTLEYVHVGRILCFTVKVLCVGFVKNKLKQENFSENIYGWQILVSNKNEQFFFSFVAEMSICT